MITGVLILSLALLSLIRSGENRYNILVFAALCAAFQFLSDNIPDERWNLYYLAAAIIDLLIIIVISKTVKITQTTIDLQLIAKWFIFANAAGWVIYELYYPHYLYDTICLALFISALIVAVKKGGSSDLGSITDFSNDTIIHSGYNSCNTQMQINKKKV